MPAAPIAHVKLHRQPAHHQKLNSTCDALRAQLESRGLVKYVDTILTTHVCKNPPDLEAGLRVLLQLKGEFCGGGKVRTASDRDLFQRLILKSWKMLSNTSFS